MVFSSQHSEAVVTIPLVDPHYPANVVSEANALAADVNAERAKHGLPALVRDDTLDRFAYAKAVEMAARGYFGHTDPNGITFQDRLQHVALADDLRGREHRVRLGRAARARCVHEQPAARANVLDGNERKIGVAVVTVGDRETFYVEDFSQ